MSQRSCRMAIASALSIAVAGWLTLTSTAWGQVGQNRAVLSVVAIRNQTSEAIAYHIQWPGEKEQAASVPAGGFKLHWHAGEAVKAQIRLQTGSKPELRTIAARDYLGAQGPPAKLTDGQLFSFRANRNGSGVAFVEDFPFDKSRFPQERQILESERERRNFPYLMTNYEVLGPSMKPYNCISWTLGIVERGTWPGSTIADFDKLYGGHGYQRSDKLDFSLQPGIKKLALYARVKGKTQPWCTHGAKQEPDGSWTSKLGPLALIKHLTVECLNGPYYGELVAMYWKKE